MLACSYFSLLHEVEMSKKIKKISQKTKRMDKSGVNVNLITKLTTPDVDYL